MAPLVTPELIRQARLGNSPKLRNFKVFEIRTLFQTRVPSHENKASQVEVTQGRIVGQ
jgi:hypothetical protein